MTREHVEAKLKDVKLGMQSYEAEHLRLQLNIAAQNGAIQALQQLLAEDETPPPAATEAT